MIPLLTNERFVWSKIHNKLYHFFQKFVKFEKSMSMKNVNILELMEADIPLPISSVAEIYGLSRSVIKAATDEFKISKGKFGLRCFTPPGAAKVRIRPSAVKAWFNDLEDREAE
jgi:hypothetical protein